VAFYGGQEVQSAQALFAPSLSATNIVSGASDIQLDARGGRGVYLNRGFESGQPAFGGDSGLQSPGYDSGYKPIEIKSQGFAGSSRAWGNFQNNWRRSEPIDLPTSRTAEEKFCNSRVPEHAQIEEALRARNSQINGCVVVLRVQLNKHDCSSWDETSFQVSQSELNSS
jgi:hypothetical protein